LDLFYYFPACGFSASHSEGQVIPVEDRTQEQKAKIQISKLAPPLNVI